MDSKDSDSSCFCNRLVGTFPGYVWEESPPSQVSETNLAYVLCRLVGYSFDTCYQRGARYDDAGRYQHYPGTTYFGANLSTLEDTAPRVLAAWYLLGQDSGYPAVNFDAWNNNAAALTSTLILIQQIDAASTVLLKNSRALPLKAPNTIAIVSNGAANLSRGANGTASFPCLIGVSSGCHNIEISCRRDCDIVLDERHRPYRCEDRELFLFDHIIWIVVIVGRLFTAFKPILNCNFSSPTDMYEDVESAGINSLRESLETSIKK
ncbi:hypothetical protein B0H16DRAFT_1762881 [Mycena metata]|uniref:Uncharacterized protein n=1 Tax=Mycena metata TaxID=1033252 RepID=A0AAD7I9Q8_9AGAR|nr:hypothetical protein B0H16DRAFT_1762881 [Mycena metata]